MHRSAVVFVVFLPLFTTVSRCVDTPTRTNRVRPTCPASVAVCEVWLELHHGVTMHVIAPARPDMDDILPIKYPIVVYPNGTALIRSNQCPLGYLGTLPPGNSSISCTDFSKVPIGDGRYKNVFLFNNSLPAPPIVVHKDQQVVVHVKNSLVNEATTIHFHGLHQHNTPWMDGVGSISQCPILPGESFTYRFLATQTGTYWYHSHYGTQRTMGINGPFIVLEKPEQALPKPEYPTFNDDFYMVVMDWFMDNSENILQLAVYNSVAYAYGWDVPVEDCYTGSTKQADGFDTGVIPFESALINGRGRIFDSITNTPINSHIPLEVYTVKKGEFYRFRLISAAMTYVFRLSIDNHPLHIIASDGNDLKPKQVDYLIITGGERYDFYIKADDPSGTGLYWIRLETLEDYDYLTKPRKFLGHVEAILQYESAPLNQEPASSGRNCTKYQCTALNCPFKYYPKSMNITCIALDELQSLQPTPTIQPTGDKPFIEKFLNFHWGRFRGGMKSVVNNILHIPPKAPLQIYPGAAHQHITACDRDHCETDSELCMCTHQIDIPLGSIVQLVLLTSYLPNPDGTLHGNSHQIHLHGYSFQVVKVGYPVYNTTTGLFQDMTHDLSSSGPFYQYSKWTDATWSGGHVPGVVTSDPPVKDTVIVPVGGYVVVRFVADNPGFWYMHCHTEFHNEEGLSLYLKVGEIEEMNAAPSGMSTCGNFDWTSEEFQSLVNSPRPPVLSSEPVDVFKYQLAVGVLSAVCIFLLLSLALQCCQMNSRKRYGYQRLPEKEDLLRKSSAKL